MIPQPSIQATSRHPGRFGKDVLGNQTAAMEGNEQP